MMVRLAVALTTAVLLTASAPSARAGWSAPVDLGAGSGPALWTGTDGRIRVVASDTVRTWIAFGTRTGRFSAPEDLAPGLGPTAGPVRAAPRPDGSALVALEEAGCPFFAVHCTAGEGDPGLRAVVVHADGTRGSRQTLAGPEELRGGPELMPVAEPDGRWAVAWKSAIPVGGAFRYRVRLADGTADGHFAPATTVVERGVNVGIWMLDAAAGADGTLALAWIERPPGASAQVWAAIRAPGTVAFGAAELLSGEASDGAQSPQVAVGENGTVTVAWSTVGSGALLRDRPPGGPWSPSQTLTADPAPALHLVPAPAGGLAAIWTPGALSGEEADAPLRVALRPRGGTFLRADVTQTGGRSGGHLAFDAAGTAYAAWAWQSGQAWVTLRPPGGAWTAPAQLTSERTAGVAIAAGPPSLAAVAWSSEAAGGQTVAASVFSRTNQGLAAPTPESETGVAPRRGPRATVRLLDRRLGARERVLVSCDVPCRALATASVLAGSRWAPLAPTSDRRLLRVHRLTFRVPARVLRRMRAIRKPLVLRVSVRVRDRAGRSGARGLAFALRRPR